MPHKPGLRQNKLRSGGLPHALAAYCVWGLLPLYVRHLHAVPALAFISWRTIFTLLVCLVLVAMRREAVEILQVLHRPRVLAMLAVSACLIGGNWLIYVSAIQAGHIFAASLGYYINPLVNILLGTLFLHERLSAKQWLAVAIAGVGVAILALGGANAGSHATLGIALALGTSFSAYGLVRKLAPIAALPGLTVEAGLIVIPSIAYLLASNAPGPGGVAFHFGADPALSALLSLSGVLTAVPLWLFAEATRRMEYSTMGFIQFTSPSVMFFLGLFVFHEPLPPVHLAAFVTIWCALAVFCWDMWAKNRRA